jgi:YbbR domain-containing protein
MQSNISRGKRILYIVLSVVIAIGIWAYVDSVKDYTVYSRTYTLPVTFAGENTTLADRGLMLLDDSDASIKLKFEGSRKLIAQLEPSKVHVQVDLSDVTETGKQNLSYKIVYPNNKFSKGISSVSASSYTVFVDIGELYSKSVEIRCDIQGEVADGYIAGAVKTVPEKLELRGQQEDVDAVSYAKVTLDIDNAQESVTKSLNYQLYDKNNKLIRDTGNIHPVANLIKVTLPVNVVKELPLKVNFTEYAGASLSNVDYSISPAEITVSGPAEKLKDVDSIVLSEFDLSKLGGAAEYHYAITVPDECENLSGVTKATMKIAFKDMGTSTLNVKNIECRNVPEGKTVTVLTDELSVKLRGKSSDLKSITANDIQITADLSDVSSASGSYTVPATIKVNSDGDVGVVGTYQIKITISNG